MIIGISGKIGSGKDTIGNMIRHLTSVNSRIPFEEWLDDKGYQYPGCSSWEIKKFAHKLKLIASIVTGIPIESFESQEFKRTVLPYPWNYWRLENTGAVIKRFSGKFYAGHFATLEAAQAKINSMPSPRSWKAVLTSMTVRELLQKLGTDAMRVGLHGEVWVNALFADYVPTIFRSEVSVRASGFHDYHVDPNWVITDVRFMNEVEAIRKRGGIMIRVDRPPSEWSDLSSLHPSETALDHYRGFNYIINNEGSMEDLEKEVRDILIKEKILID